MEYKILSFPDLSAEVEAALNTNAMEGWEVLSVLPVPMPYRLAVVMRRPWEGLRCENGIRSELREE